VGAHSPLGFLARLSPLRPLSRSIFWERSTGASNGSPGGTDDDEQEMSSASSRAITALFLATNLRVWVLIALGAKWLFEFLI
jgi:hypothetical protein